MMNDKDFMIGNPPAGGGLPEFSHKPVLLDEVLEALKLRGDGMFLDGTVGGAGHSSKTGLCENPRTRQLANSTAT